MTDPKDSYLENLKGLKTGQSKDQTEFYERWKAHVLAIANRKLDPGLGARVSPESILQSVMRSVLMGVQEGEFDYVNNWAMVNTLLTQITVRKCLNKNRHHHAKKREMGKVVDWDTIETEISAKEIEIAAESEEEGLKAEFSERLDVIRKKLSEREQMVLELLLIGRSNVEIAQLCQYSVRTIDRLKKKIGEIIFASLSNH